MRFDTKTLFYLTFGILILILWKWYWKFQMMYNSSVLSLYTPDTFPVYNNKRFDERCRQGLGDASNKSVVIAGMVRDIESRIPEIKKKVLRVAKIFKNYQILIVENDSKDRSRELLLEWAKENPRVTVLGCGRNAPRCSISLAKQKTDGHHVDRQRINKMTHLRNIYLQEIKEKYALYDYSIFWDLDMIGSVYLDGICNSLGYLNERPDVDVVCANGIYRWGPMTLFYDTYALLHKGEPFHIDHKTCHDIRKGLWEMKYDRGEEPVEVDSCFSGFAIYRTTVLLPDRVIYDMSSENNLECEHVRLNMKIDGIKVVNPSMINLVLENS
jgi:Cryptococcal mannosyltransferase 1/Glycosyl transferase family 2